nr:hypothetical protein [Allomuricauda sp.]
MRVFKYYIYVFLTITMVLFSYSSVIAQNPVEISVFSESTSVPFSGISLKPFHPGVQVGMDVPWRETNRHKTFLSINLRYIFHKNLYQAIALNLELGYDYKIDFGANVKTGVGIGYLHSFNVKERYRLENGSYTKQRDMGRSRFTPSLSFGLGYRFNPNSFDTTEVFAKQQYWLELPYSPGFIPLMSHANTMIGAKFHPN